MERSGIRGRPVRIPVISGLLPPSLPQAGTEPATIHVVQMWSKITEWPPPSAAGSSASDLPFLRASS